MSRPIRALVHPDALRHNLEVFRAGVPDARIWAVIKADAYGHGIERALDGLRAADGMALLEVQEAQRVRALGWRGPILLIEGVFDARELEWCSRLDLWHVVHCDEQIDWLAAHKTQLPHRVFLKLNSGMNRLGFPVQRFRSAWARLQALPQVDEISFMTHFSDADGPRGIAHQIQAFRQATHDLPGDCCVCNSAAAALHAGDTALQGDWVRAGIMLYGSAVDPATRTAAEWGLQPGMSLRSALIGIQSLQAGETVGYGSIFTAPEPMRVGVVACGYADGYPRHCGTGTPVLVGGVRTQLVGRVSMDMLAVDLRPLDAAGVRAERGTEVTLWGRSAHGAELGIDEIAQAAGTLGYELMCAVAPRVPMVAEPLQGEQKKKRA